MHDLRLYTLCINGRPVLVLSAGVAPAMEDKFSTNAKLMKVDRAQRAFLDSLPDEVRRSAELEELRTALDTWLGTDLRALRHNGKPLWNGNRRSLKWREARPDEASVWRASLHEALDTGEQDAGDEDWLAFLVTVEGG